MELLNAWIKYAVAIGFVVFSMKVAWGAWKGYKPGSDPLTALSEPVLKILGFILTYVVMINAVPFLWDYGFAKTFNHVGQSSSRIAGAELIGSTASLVSDIPYVAKVNVPEAEPLRNILPEIPALRGEPEVQQASDPAPSQPVAAPRQSAPQPTATALPPRAYPTVAPKAIEFYDPRDGEVKNLDVSQHQPNPTPMPVYDPRTGNTIEFDASKFQPNPTSTPAGGPTSSYVVKRGDTLFKLAKTFYGDGNKWTLICNANQHVLGQNCNALAPNQIISIP